MTIGMLFKVFTQDGRRNLAQELIKPYISVETISKEVANGVCNLADKRTAKMDDSRCEKVSCGCKMIGDGFNTIGGAISPNGEDGKAISENERIEICGRIRGGLEIVLTDELLDNVVECVVARIP